MKKATRVKLEKKNSVQQPGGSKGFRSIRWRLVASYVLLALLAVVVVGVVALTLLRQSLAQQEKAALQANADAIAQQAVTRLFPSPGRGQGLSQLVETSAFLGNVRVRILGSDKQTVLADSGPRDQTTMAMWIDPDQNVTIGNSGTSLNGSLVLMPSGKVVNLPPGVPVTSVRRIDTPWGSMLVFETSGSQSAAPSNSTPAASDIVAMSPIGNSSSPIAYVEVSGGVNFSSQAVSTAQAAFLWAALISALLAAVVGLVVSRRLTTPLAGLSTAAAQMSAGDLSVRAPVSSRDEFGQLAGQFNLMAGGLETSFKQLSEERDTLRRFVADASHELRTPITALQTFTDLLQGSAADDPQARIEFLAESQKQLTRLEWITRNLLDLSRLEAGIEALDLAAYDAAEITRSVGVTFEPLAKEKGLELAVSSPAEPLEIRCDRLRVEMALSNLLQNAFKFTPAGGRVELSCEPAGGLVRWSVTDTGVGIPPEDLPHIFERFYRGSNPGVEGSGLGLAIVYSIVQAHGGKVTADSQPSQGSKFILELPRGN